MPTPLELFTTYNPYPSVGTQYSAGLDYIIAHLTTGDVDDLVTQVTNYVNGLGLLPSTAAVQMEISSVAYNAVNSYINGQKGNYSGGQLLFVNRMTGPSFTSGFTTDSLPTRLFDIQQNIPQSGLSAEQQQPLFLATMIGQTAYTYWLYQINNASTSPWTTYLGTALTSATANLSFYSAAAMHGSLFGARSTFKGMIEETTQIVTVNIVSALIAALTVGAGKVLYGWIQRIQNLMGVVGNGTHGGAAVIVTTGGTGYGSLYKISWDQHNNACTVSYFDSAGHFDHNCYGAIEAWDAQGNPTGCVIGDDCAVGVVRGGGSISSNNRPAS